MVHFVDLDDTDDSNDNDVANIGDDYEVYGFEGDMYFYDRKNVSRLATVSQTLDPKRKDDGEILRTTAIKEYESLKIKTDKKTTLNQNQQKLFGFEAKAEPEIQGDSETSVILGENIFEENFENFENAMGITPCGDDGPILGFILFVIIFAAFLFCLYVSYETYIDNVKANQAALTEP